jgi:hypothetical protein
VIRKKLHNLVYGTSLCSAKAKHYFSIGKLDIALRFVLKKQGMLCTHTALVFQKSLSEPNLKMRLSYCRAPLGRRLLKVCPLGFHHHHGYSLDSISVDKSNLIEPIRSANIPFFKR